MHISFESGVLEDPLHPPIDDMYLMTTNPNLWPNEAEEIKITFAKGLPQVVENLSTKVKVEDSVEILKYLNKLGGKHGIGRIDVNLLMIQFICLNHFYYVSNIYRLLRTGISV